MNKVLLLFFTLLSINCFSQFSKTHYIPPITAQDNLVGDHYLYISTPSTTNVNIKVIENGGSVITDVVNNSKPFIYNIGQGNNTQLFTPKIVIGIIQNKGYIVEAENLIYVSVRVNAGLTTAGTYNHAGGLVSKGNSALGKVFRLGAMLNPLYDTSLLNFASILSTEDNTTVTISNIPDGTLLTDGTIINGPIIKPLQKNESYVLALENYSNTTSNSSKMIGALVVSNNNVVVNSGSFGGSNNTTVTGTFPMGTGRDVGFDQIVPLEKTGKEYIFVKGNGTGELESIILVAHSDNTQIFTNGNLTPVPTTLNAGEYYILNGNDFINGNLYVTTTENVFAYQSISGTNSAPNQNLFFVPPINCSTPNVVDNIPEIQAIGITNYSGGLNIVTETDASVLINNTPISALPIPITGTETNTPSFVRYTINGLTGNIAVKSTKQVYVSYFGTNNFATYGGYYSGFDTKPEIITNNLAVTTSNCIPNVKLEISTLSSYDTFQWIFNDDDIAGADTNTYTPTQPGYYQVRGSISGCGTPQLSDKIPVSICTPDIDNDGVNNNVDIDNDNDGIKNCTESYGNLGINTSNIDNGTIVLNNYTNSFNGNLTSNRPTTAATFIGKTNGDFTTEVPIGNVNSVTYLMNFTNPISLALEYISAGNSSDLLNSNSEFVLKSPTNKTITVLNPNNQLLIDTNFDGVFESNITEFSSFEIRFRLNSAVPLAAGAGKFSFRSFMSESISFTHKNLSDTEINKASFNILATCIPKDTDLDGIPDQLDLDSDNDGIPDRIEAQGSNPFIAYTTVDVNKDGLSDAFGTGLIPIDSDSDGIKNYLDLDSDNDGIYDLAESGSNAIDANLDGRIDGLPISFGPNGLSNSVETSPESGILNYTIRDTDSDGIRNYRELDSDNDGCNDVIEAGFADPNNDGLLGAVVPPTVDTNGIVTSGIGYTTPSDNYITAAPIVITTQPLVPPTCELQNATVTIDDNGENTYRWELSTNGSTWVPPDDATYSGVTTNTLLIKQVKNAMNGYTYRVQLNKIGNACGLLSNETTLTVYPLPVVNPVTIVQCDDDSDGFSNFNLTVKNNTISSDPTAQFSYYISFSGAENSEPNKLINNPLSFKNTTAGSMSVWARTENSNGCFSVSQVNLVVSTTQIPPSYNMTFEICDDLSTASDDTDGIATFNFSSVTTDILRILPDPNTAYSIKYYKNEQDALSENDEILNTTNYRNEGYRDEQRIWVRVESTADNACYGLSPRILLKVNPKPNIDTNEDQQDDELVCSNLPSFFVRLDSGIQDGSPESDYTYQWTKDNMSLTSETMSFLEVNAVGTYSVKVNSAFGCSRTRTIKVTASDVAAIQSIDIVDLAETNTVTINVTGQGIYEYSLDAPNGPFQLSNFFDNVSAGIHDVYVNDQNGCGTIPKPIAVLGVPKFFTPNGDGFNDYWNLKGANATFNVKSIIYIYDRYGKLVFQVDPSSDGWDGTYNKSPLPADDYWFTIKLENGREATGHFSLKR